MAAQPLFCACKVLAAGSFTYGEAFGDLAVVETIHDGEVKDQAQVQRELGDNTQEGFLVELIENSPPGRTYFVGIIFEVNDASTALLAEVHQYDVDGECPYPWFETSLHGVVAIEVQKNLREYLLYRIYDLALGHAVPTAEAIDVAAEQPVEAGPGCFFSGPAFGQQLCFVLSFGQARGRIKGVRKPFRPRRSGRNG